MAISLDSFLRLRDDKKGFARIEQLVEARTNAQKAMDAARAAFDAASRELEQLGIIIVSGAGESGRSIGAGGSASKRRGRPPGSKNKARATTATALTGGGNGNFGKKAAKRGPKAGGERRSSDDYVKALDEIGAEFTKAGKDDIRGPDLVKAMKARGFTSKQVVMNQVRDHKGWKRKGE
jgi:hypothetical protein